jgi:hypothetical protein
MTASRRPGRPVAVTRDDGTVELFARGANDTLLHLRDHFFLGWSAEILSGPLAGDPTAVLTTSGKLHVFARGRGSRLLHWRQHPTDGQLLEPIDHGWRIGYDPVAAAGPNGSVGVLARGADDQLIRWWSDDGESWTNAQHVGGVALTNPAAVLRVGGEGPDVVVGGADSQLHQWGPVRVAPFSDVVFAQRWRSVGGRRLQGAPVIVSWGHDRLDVLAATEPGAGFGPETMGHWGRTGVPDESTPSSVRWFGVDPMERGETRGPACAVATAPGHAEAFARNRGGRLVRWSWDRDPGTFAGDEVGWRGPTEVQADASAIEIGAEPTAVVRGTLTHVYTWDSFGARLWELIRDGEIWSARAPAIPWPADEVVARPERRVPIRVDAIVARPADLLNLGVSWSGLDLVPGDPPVLRRTGDPALLMVALPPQHVGEEIAGAEGPLVAPITGISPHGVWRSVLSGPSQLVIVVGGDQVELTTAGVLRALKGSTLRFRQPDDDETGTPFTEIELPWQLFVSPDGATATHATGAAMQSAETVPLWRSRIASSDGALRILSANGEDPFELPLGLGTRESLATAPGPAVAKRLEVSALGGTLHAFGSWPDLEWEHEASLGRDHRVRVLMRGALYPFGHRAQYFELTERFPPEPDSEPIAALRKNRVLTVTEPVRRLGVDGAQMPSAAFPFDLVTITTKTFEGLDAPDGVVDPKVRSTGPASPDWQGKDQLRKDPEGLRAELDALRAALSSAPRPPHVPGRPDVIEARASMEPPDVTTIASEFLRRIEDILDLEEKIEAVLDDGNRFVNEFFCPRRNKTWVKFPVTCESGGTTVSFTIPMLFVRDTHLPETTTMEAFDTFDDTLGNRLAEHWATIRAERPTAADLKNDPDEAYAGVVSVQGTPIDLVRAPAERRVEDVQVVQGLHITGMVLGRELRPRLGPAPGIQQRGPQWGMDITLPAMRSLLPDQSTAHRALVAYAPNFVAGVDATVALKMAWSGVEAAQANAGQPVRAAELVVDFTRNADRSGGLAAPKMAADAISRTAGPLNLEGLADPAKLFDPAATLLGVPFRELLKDLPAGKTPNITTDLSGPQPVVKMNWPEQDLQPFPPFGKKVVKADVPPPPPPKLTLDVTTCGPAVKSECTVTDFSLSFPTAKPLIILNFDRLRFLQESGREPTLDIDGLDVQFSEALDILQSLQGAVPLAGKGPTFEVSSNGIIAAYSLPIPNVSSGAFVLRNLIFSARVVVPFQGDLVSVAIAFASEAKPFNLSVMLLGGGGYIDIELDGRGLRRLDVSLEFGASVAVDFVIASGEAHILGGIRFQLLPDDSVQLVGFLRIGGSLEVLGLVSVSVEMVLALGYQSHGNKLVGRATLVIEIDLTIYSDSLEIDSGEWTIAGGEERGALPRPAPLGPNDYAEMWQKHKNAYEPVP